jgi:hypothetical protein
MKLSADAGLTMAVYTAEPGSSSHDALNLLASWAATLDPGRGGQRGGETLTGSGRARSRILVTAPASPAMALWSCRTRVRQDRRSCI